MVDKDSTQRSFPFFPSFTSLALSGRGICNIEGGVLFNRTPLPALIVVPQEKGLELRAITYFYHGL